MAILTDTDLDKLFSPDRQEQDGSKLVLTPLSEQCITPVGYDLRVGATYTSSDISEVRKNLGEGETITIRPGTTALISTLEYVRMPTDRTISGLIESKVSLVSKGLSHVSTTVDPDWKGHLLIAIHNHAVESVKLNFGQKFCTVVFLRNESPSTRLSDHPPDRLDIFLDEFRQRSVKVQRTRRFQDLIPPSIILGAGLVGFLSFGNQPGFIASVAVGVAVAQYVERRYLR